jgi:hypothetical protein
VVLGDIDADRLKAAESALSEGMWLAPALLEEDEHRRLGLPPGGISRLSAAQP